MVCITDVSAQRMAFVIMKRSQTRKQTTDRLLGMKHMSEKLTSRGVNLVQKVRKLPDVVALVDG